MRTNLIKTVVLLTLTLAVNTNGQSEDKCWDSVNLRNELIEVQAVPKIGGRIIQYKLGDYEFFWVNKELAGTDPPASRLASDGGWLNYGGDKLWPAPQGWSDDEHWFGPPDAVLDGGPYTAELTKEHGRTVAIQMTSEKDPRSGIQFTRKFKIFDGTTHVKIKATMENIDDKPRRWGIWAVTQFDTSNRHGDGYNGNFWVYCPINPDSMYHKGYNVILGLVSHLSYKPDYENGMMRVHYDYRVGKIGMDCSAGWIATLDATDGYVFVHQFTYEPDKPYPDEASVEFWMNGQGELVAWGKGIEKMPESLEDNPYIMESEVLSPFASLEPGESYTFCYDWYAAKVPAGSIIVSCNDVGIACKPLSAKLCGGKLILDGQFGVFYKGSIKPVLLDENGAEIKKGSNKVNVTPLEPLVFGDKPQLTEKMSVPDNAVKIALILSDVNGKKVGELARAEISRN